MLKLLFFITINFAIITPLIILTYDKSKSKNSLVLLALYVLIYLIILPLPNIFPAIKIIHGNWNWSGKIYSIIISLFYLFLIRKEIEGNNYFTLSQKNIRFRRYLYFVIVILIYFIYHAHTKSTTLAQKEQLLFQLIMPSLDEEIAFRVIMLGLLLNSVRKEIQISKYTLTNIPILLSSLIFGLGHSIFINPSWEFYFNGTEFVSTFLIGFFFGWLSIKNESILMPLLIHSILNTFVIIIHL